MADWPHCLFLLFLAEHYALEPWRGNQIRKWLNDLTAIVRKTRRTSTPLSTQFKPNQVHCSDNPNMRCQLFSHDELIEFSLPHIQMDVSVSDETMESLTQRHIHRHKERVTL